MPSSHLILCRPLLLPPSTFPSIRVFSNESVRSYVTSILGELICLLVSTLHIGRGCDKDFRVPNLNTLVLVEAVGGMACLWGISEHRIRPSQSLGERGEGPRGEREKGASRPAPENLRRAGPGAGTPAWLPLTSSSCLYLCLCLCPSLSFCPSP